MSVAQNIKSFISSVPAGVKIIAVTKTQPVEIIQEVYGTGYKIFGENRIQELTTKQKNLPADIEWHMIGHLQTNKVKYICPFVNMIHSVDSLNLLAVINKEGIKNNRIVDVLMQIYIANEETKFGLDEDELFKIISSSDFSNFKNIRVKGLMGMATFTEDKSQIRSEFRRLTKIFNKTKETFFVNDENFSEISMGMSNDYKIAIEEGSTIIRIGSLIFGERPFL